VQFAKRKGFNDATRPNTLQGKNNNNINALKIVPSIQSHVHQSDLSYLQERDIAELP